MDAVSITPVLIEKRPGLLYTVFCIITVFLLIAAGCTKLNVGYDFPAEQGENIQIGDYSMEFSDLRYWSSFRVGEDHGLILLQIALWVGLISLILRYIPDLLKWFSPSQRS